MCSAHITANLIIVCRANERLHHIDRKANYTVIISHTELYCHTKKMHILIAFIKWASWCRFSFFPSFCITFAAFDELHPFLSTFNSIFFSINLRIAHEYVNIKRGFNCFTFAQRRLSNNERIQKSEIEFFLHWMSEYNYFFPISYHYFFYPKISWTMDCVQ